jgi:transcriptional regulator with XRE-family HTH domain
LQPLDAERVRERRNRRMLSQQEVADRAGTSLFTIQRIERGEGNVRPKTGRGVAAALGVPIEELLPKVQAPLFRELPEQAPTEVRRTGYLRPWRAFVWKLVHRWEKEPPKTSAEISPLFEAMNALVQEGVFEPSEASAAEPGELSLLMDGFQRLNDIANTVEKDEEAEKRRATFALIQETASA